MEITSQMATIIVAVLGAFVTCSTFVLGKWHERKIELRKIKEEQYITFLTALLKVKIGTCENLDEVKEELSIKVQTIFLVGNKDVQTKLTVFLEIFFDKGKELNQNKLYGELIQSMKIDLYGRKWKVTPKCLNSIDNIGLTIFTEKNEKR